MHLIRISGSPDTPNRVSPEQERVKNAIEASAPGINLKN